MRGGLARRRWWRGWLMLVATIMLLSLLGRPLLTLLRAMIAQAWLGPLLNIALLLAVTAAVVGAYRVGRLSRLYSLLWLLPLVWFAASAFPIVEERLHLLLFGALGFLSLPLFGLRGALLRCSAIGALDEGLQWWLPERVGDWGDVLLNVVAALAGVALAFWLAPPAAAVRQGAPAYASDRERGDG